jgi:hypothetical protein
MQEQVGSNGKRQLNNKDGHKVNLGRHQAQCSICSHPEREEIETLWVDWVHVGHITSIFKISPDAIYRHMHAVELFDKRTKNIVRALEQIIEKVGAVSPTASAVVSAIKLYLKLNRPGQGTEPAHGSNLKDYFARMSSEEREAFIRDGSLPRCFPGAAGATVDDGQEGEKEDPDDEPKRLQ